MHLCTPHYLELHPGFDGLPGVPAAVNRRFAGRIKLPFTRDGGRVKTALTSLQHGRDLLGVTVARKMR